MATTIHVKLTKRCYEFTASGIIRIAHDHVLSKP